MRGRRSERASAVHPTSPRARLVIGACFREPWPIMGAPLGTQFTVRVSGAFSPKAIPYRRPGTHVPGPGFARNTPPNLPTPQASGDSGDWGGHVHIPGVMTPGYGANRLRRMCANEWPLARDAGAGDRNAPARCIPSPRARFGHSAHVSANRGRLWAHPLGTQFTVRVSGAFSPKAIRTVAWDNVPGPGSARNTPPNLPTPQAAGDSGDWGARTYSRGDYPWLRCESPTANVRE